MNKLTNWVKDVCTIGIYGILIILVFVSLYVRFTFPQLTETQLFIYMLPTFLKFGCAVGLFVVVLWMIKNR